RHRGAQLLALPLEADFLLARLVGREHLAAVGHGQVVGCLRRHGALGQAFDVVGVDRGVLAGLEHQAQHGRGGRLLVVVGLRARVVVVAALLDALAAHAHGQAQALVQHRQRVADGKAVEPGFTHARGIGQVAAEQRHLRARAAPGVVDVVDHAKAHAPGIALGGRVGAGRGHQLMAHAARGQARADADLARAHAVLALVVEARARGVAGRIRDGHAAQGVVFLAAAQAACGPGRGGVVDVPFGAQRGEQVALGGVRPVLAVVGLVVGHGRDEVAGRHAGATAVVAVALVAHVARQANVAAAPVQAQAQGGERAVFAIHARAAVAAHGVQADAGAPVRAEAARDVGGDKGLAARLYAGAHARQRIVAGALGQQADGAANAAAAGCCAIEEGVGAAQHLHTLEELRGDVLARQQAVQAVVGDVVRIDREAAKHIQLLEVAEAARLAHARVVEQHVAHALGLGVLDQLLGVAGGGERGVLPVQRAQHAVARPRGHLAACEGLGQALGRCVGAGLHRHSLQHGVTAPGLGNQRLMAAQAKNGQGYG
ncbi:unnamed protein product, partial [Ilex paraguariensis]